MICINLFEVLLLKSIKLPELSFSMKQIGLKLKKTLQEKSWRTIQRIFIDKKLDLERTMNELVNPFLKKCQNVACEQKTTSEKWKFGSNKTLDIERTISELGKQFTMKLRDTIKKPLARKRILFKHRFLTLL